VRVVKFGNSIELCGGTHVKSSGQIGFFIIRHETSIASGIRRIEALTADAAELYYHDYDFTIKELKNTLKNPIDLVKAVQNLIEQNRDLQKSLDAIGNKFVLGMKNSILAEAKVINGINFIAKKVELNSENAKNLIFALASELDNSLIVLASINEDKPVLMVSVSKNLEKNNGLHAGNIVRELAKEINGGGGGQAHFATAGGKNSAGIEKALFLASKFLESKA